MLHRQLMFQNVKCIPLLATERHRQWQYKCNKGRIVYGVKSEVKTMTSVIDIILTVTTAF